MKPDQNLSRRVPALVLIGVLALASAGCGAAKTAGSAVADDAARIAGGAAHAPVAPAGAGLAAGAAVRSDVMRRAHTLLASAAAGLDEAALRQVITIACLANSAVEIGSADTVQEAVLRITAELPAAHAAVLGSKAVVLAGDLRQAQTLGDQISTAAAAYVCERAQMAR